MSEHARDWASELTALGLACGFFGKVFYERPTVEFVSHLADEDLFGAWPLDSEDEEVREGLAALRAFCADWRAGTRPDLDADYTRLFLGPGLPDAPPWESVHLSAEHVMFERQTLAVRAAYRRFGLEVSQLHQEPDDHFGLEMAFLAHLCGLGLSALEEGQPERVKEVLRAHEDFLREHVLAWAPSFLTLVVARARTDFYRGVAHLARGFLADSARHLAGDPGPS